MYRLNERGWLFLFIFIFFWTGYNVLKIKDHQIICKINKKGMLFLGCIVMVVGLYEIYASYAWRAKTDIGYIENSNGERFEVPLRYLGKVQTYKEEFYGDREIMEKYTTWWQKRRDFNGFLGIDITDWDLDFDSHYYIITYGRTVSIGDYICV